MRATGLALLVAFAAIVAGLWAAARLIVALAAWRLP